MEFLRGDPRASVFVLSIGQTISIAMAVLGVAFVIYERKGRA
jgi:prolipoprotein diacylglyceryltransferase